MERFDYLSFRLPKSLSQRFRSQCDSANLTLTEGINALIQCAVERPELIRIDAPKLPQAVTNPLPVGTQFTGDQFAEYLGTTTPYINRMRWLSKHKKCGFRNSMIDREYRRWEAISPGRGRNKVLYTKVRDL